MINALTYTTTSTGPSAGILVVGLLIAVLEIVGLWKVFTKAGTYGWGAIIPIFNYYLLLKIAGKPGWWLILLLIPIVNIVVLFIIMMEVAKNFGKSALFGVGMALLGPIFVPILGFGSATYQGPTIRV